MCSLAFQMIRVNDLLILSIVPQCLWDRTGLNSLQKKGLRVKEIKLLYGVNILPLIQTHTSSGTNSYQTDHQHSF